MRKFQIWILLIFALGAIVGCSSEPALSKDESMESVLKGTVAPNGPPGDPGSKSGVKKVDPAKADPSKGGN